MINYTSVKISKYQADRDALMGSQVLCRREPNTHHGLPFPKAFCSVLLLNGVGISCMSLPFFPLSTLSQRSGCSDLQICTHRPCTHYPDDFVPLRKHVFMPCWNFNMEMWQVVLETPWKTAQMKGEKTQGRGDWFHIKVVDRQSTVVTVIPSLICA